MRPITNKTDCDNCKNSFYNPFDQIYCAKKYDLEKGDDCKGIYYKPKKKHKTCKHSDFFKKTFTNLADEREYWLFTEVFCYLHDGKDFCNCNTKTK